MLTLEAATYRYAGSSKPSLRDVNLSFGEGEVVGVIGANEAGKTTLALVASGLAPRSIGGTFGGRLLVDGTDMAGRPIHELAARIGVCFQNPFAQLSQVTDTVFEEVAFAAMNLGLDRSVVLRQTTEALATLGLTDLAARDPRQLSGGQLQLVAIAGLLAVRPRYLVLDEPTSQLDPEGKQLVTGALADLAKSGLALLVTEHDTDLLSRLCSRIVALESGRVVLEGAATAVLSDRRLEDLGVERPSAVRLGEAVAAAGLSVELPA